MTEAYEAVLRKSLDTVDRRQRWMKIIAVVFIILGGGNVALAMIYLQDLKMLYIATFVGLILWTGGLAVAVLGVSNRNAQLLLQAIALLSEASGKASEEHQKNGSSTPLQLNQNDGGKN
ncbi:MAG: hypothetical protein WB424_02635 [Terracidiphilus sp.]